MKSRRNSILGLQYFSTWDLLSEYLEQTRTMQELILPAWEASQSEHRIHDFKLADINLERSEAYLLKLEKSVSEFQSCRHFL